MSWPRWHDATELGKWRISLAVALSAICGYAAKGGNSYQDALLVGFGIFLMAAAASAINQIQEASLDKIMHRTASRPIPAGRSSRRFAVIVALALAVMGSLSLLLLERFWPLVVSWLTLLWYNAIYTPLKRRSAFAAVPGSVVGALPPIAGWLAAGGQWTDSGALAIGLFFFVGQIPHFWLLLLKLDPQYRAAGFPTLTGKLSPNAIKRTTYAWICSTAVMGCLLPLFHIPASRELIPVILIGSVALVVWFLPLIKGRSSFDPTRSFFVINIYYLLIMLSITGSWIWALSLGT